ncbi:T6SS effector BTH_I2691 family protein [Pseudoduganella sp. R-32]|uniref:T6SS effector BTH_I2691 family protein n=1 Tax=Pseudoduganella sp. R-32 TaxID=3404061 RepID=UPI003CF0FDBD
MTLNTVPGCEFCDKRGLPVLVARYALAPVTAGAPKTRALHADGKTEFVGLGDSAHYTRRLLRCGYLYVHDEARKRWEGYFVTEDAYLMRFEVGKPVPSSFTANKQPCTQTGHQQVAGMVTIPDPNKATRVWFGFSDVEWTEAVLKQHEDTAYRKKHMLVLDVKVALAGGKQENVHPIKLLGSKVAEFACDPLKATAPNAFYHAPYQFTPRRLQLEQTLETADALRKGQGVIVSLHDPLAMGIEIAVQANHLLTNKLELDQRDKTKSRKIVVSSAILQLRSAIMENARASAIDDAKELENQTLSMGMGAYSLSGFYKGMPNQVEIQKEQAKAWRRFTHRESGRARFNEAMVETFYKSYQQEVETVTETQINPLGEAHVAWTTSKRLANYMSCSFDTTDIKSGAAYVQAILNLTQGTEGIKPCFNQYEKWLNEDVFDSENILLRAMVYNNDALAKKVADATAFDSRAIPWDALAASYKKSVELISENQATLGATLLARMMGPLAYAGGHFVDGAAKLAFTILGMHSGLGWERLSFEGSRKQFRAFLVRQIIESSDTGLTKAQIKIAVDREIQLAAIHGERLEGRRTFKWVAMRQLGASTLKTPRTLNDIRFDKFKQVINSNVRLGMCIGVLQYICLTKTVADHAKSLEGDLAEARSRLAAGIIGVTGTLCETIGAAIEHMGQAGFRWAQGLTAVRWAARIKLVGQALGLVGAGIMAVWDLMKAREELQKNNITTGRLYIASGLIGLGIAIALCFGFYLVTLVFVIGYLIVVYWLEQVKDQAIHSWIENCIFGIANSYDSAELEMKELGKALT